MVLRRLARPDQRLQQCLQILNIGRGPLVQDHQIDRKPLQPPVLVGAEQLSHDSHIVGLVDPDQDDRDVTRNPVRPQGGGTARVARQHARGGPQRPVRVENAAGEALKEVGLIGPDAEMAELNLGLGPRQRGHPLEGRRVAILVGEVDHLLARRRDQRRKGDVDARARRKPYAASKADDRIEHRADGVGERPAVDHRGRCPDPAAAAEEPSAVGFPF